jgi:hypothetical protein
MGDPLLLRKGYMGIPVKERSFSERLVIEKIISPGGKKGHEAYQAEKPFPRLSPVSPEKTKQKVKGKKVKTHKGDQEKGGREMNHRS